MTTTVVEERHEVVETLITEAKQAQEIYAQFTQEQVDHIVQAVSDRMTEVAEDLAMKAHTETGFGNVKDKTTKNLFASQKVYESIKEEKTVGIIHRDEEKKVMEIGTPMGIIAALIPVTNPTSTVIFKTLISLKTRNAIVLSPHPKALQAILETARLVEEAAVKAGAPKGIIQVIESPSLEGTQALMKHEDTALILATGGAAMVKAAYSSGNPAIGVGPGNGPAFIEKSANIEATIDKIIQSKTFDCGTICASEQSIVVEEAVKGEVVEALKARNAYFMSKEESEQVAKFIMRENGTMNPQIVGKPVTDIAQLCGISIPAETTVLIAEVTTVGADNPYSREKLTPILAMYTVNDWEAGVQTCNTILENEGQGHTAMLHTTDEALVEDFGTRIKASRILINTLGTLGGIGASTNLAPSLTLGCGSLGGSSITDNVSIRQLMNIHRVAYGVE
ncbi:acetaldehyde dehydrogenase (acetylating) [Pontibacillus litoralis]|uniref:Acetaldehyde dehydrogenase n=1 Tax=Pontibacillus litoralis JSM 072002 TaxID=1385512 RepID=A0A0A5G1F0_9BACI|nr:acetaldehyde dehydrogenase (acetylating) [Pontibacillus litoralis]KGX85869.1 acetaldehyde dehydrogenase [Pontibacillus litoralis JSM 072002]